MRNLDILSILLFASQILVIVNQATGHSDTTWVCKNKKSVALRVLNDDQNTCRCVFVPPLEPLDFGEGYIHTKGIGAHKLSKVAKTWNEARKACIDEGAHLAILNSEAELKVLQERLKKEHQNVENADRTDLAYLGVHAHFGKFNFTTVLGDSLSSIGYTGWNKKKCLKWGPQPYNSDGKQKCMALIRECGSTDDHWCDKKMPYFCEKPEPCNQDVESSINLQ